MNIIHISKIENTKKRMKLLTAGTELLAALPGTTAGALPAAPLCLQNFIAAYYSKNFHSINQPSRLLNSFSRLLKTS